MDIGMRRQPVQRIREAAWPDWEWRDNGRSLVLARSVTACVPPGLCSARAETFTAVEYTAFIRTPGAFRASHARPALPGTPPVWEPVAFRTALKILAVPRPVWAAGLGYRFPDAS